MPSQAREKARKLAARGFSASEIRQKTGLSGAGARNVVSNWSPAGQAAHQAAASQRPDGGSSSDSDSGSGSGSGSDSGITLTNPEFLAAQLGASLQTQSQISSYGWNVQKEMENIRQAAETERLKYEVDNRVPVVEAEAKGKLDLQKIVNAGLQNVTRIERGSDMVRSITSMFNF